MSATGEDAVVNDRTTLGERTAALWADLRFVAGRVWYGIGAYVLLLIGGFGTVAVAGALGLLTVFVVPFVVGALVALWVFAAVVARFFDPVGVWLSRRPLRHSVTSVLTPAGRALAAAAVWQLLACRALARRERDRLAQYRDAEIPIAYRPLPDGAVATLAVVLSDPATWRDLAYLLVQPPVAVFACLGIGGLWAGAVTVLGSPFADQSLTQAWTDPVTYVAIGAGLLALAASPLLTHLIAAIAAAVGAALLSTGESARMRAELDEQRLRRGLAVEAAERERRRIERDLHDGAQQRLVALGMSLGLAREKLPDDPVAGAALVEEAHAEAKLALAELRDLARGIHPAILGDRGLDAALSALVRRTPIPVSVVVVLPQRPPPSVESAAYFVVSEALTNVSRHAGASRATVSITQADNLLVLEVTDDGGGGADPAGGTGLAGLAERVAALNGRLTVDSPPGGTTSIRAEIPCAS